MNGHAKEGERWSLRTNKESAKPTIARTHCDSYSRRNKEKTKTK
jgi:hypothetical protein